MNNMRCLTSSCGLLFLLIIISFSGCAPKVTLTTNVEPSEGGIIKQEPDQKSYRKGDLVVLTPYASDGYVFVEWSGDLSGAANPAILTLEKNTNITAKFTIVDNPVEGEGESIEGEDEPAEGEGEPTEGELEGEGEPAEGESEGEGELVEGEIEGEGEDEPTEGEIEDEGEPTLQATFSWLPEYPWVGQDIGFTASLTPLTKEPIENYTWDFGDGNTVTGMVATHQYSQPGVYPVELTVNTGSGEFQLTHDVYVDLAPTADFSVVPEQAYIHSDFHFAASTQLPDARPVRAYMWNFGDGNSSTVSEPVHQYEEPGRYEIRLTIYYKHSQAPNTSPNEDRYTTKFVTVYPEPGEGEPVEGEGEPVEGEGEPVEGEGEPVEGEGEPVEGEGEPVEGEGEEQVSVPDVVNMSLSEAESSLVAAGLVRGTLTEQVNETVPFGIVISQNPTAGELVAQGQSVNLVTSLGTLAEYLHREAWSDLATQAASDKFARFGIYASRSLMVKHPEVYLRADALWMNEIVTKYGGWQAEYEHRDRVNDDTYWDNVGLPIDNAFRNDDSASDTAFSWQNFEWASHQANASSWQELMPAGAPYFPWLDLRLPLLWNAMKGISYTTPYLSLAEALYFQLQDEGKIVYLAVTDSGQGYVIETNGATASLYDPLSASKDSITGNIVLVMSEDAVWYPLMNRDDRASDSGLSLAVQEFCSPDAQPTLTDYESELMQILSSNTMLSTAMDQQWATLFASRFGKQNGWLARPIRDLTRSLFPTNYIQCGDRYTDIPYEFATLNMVVTEMGNRLSPLTALLATTAYDAETLEQQFVAMGDQYKNWFKRQDNDWVYGEYFQIWLPNIDDKLLSGAGDCFVEACNVGAALYIAQMPDWGVWVTNWWYTSKRGGHVIAGVYTDTDARTLSNGFYVSAPGTCTNGPLWSDNSELAFPLIYRPGTGFIATGQSCNGYCFTPFVQPFTNLSYSATSAMLGEIPGLQSDFIFATGSYNSIGTSTATQYQTYIGGLQGSWSAYQLPPKSTAPVAMPDLIGLSVVEAVGALGDVEFLLQSVTYDTSETIPEGQVMQQYPSQGVLITPGSAVDVVISTGSPFMSASNYFVTTEGHGVRYLITDNQGDSWQDYAWAVSQYTDGTKDFVFTLNGEQSGVNLSNSLGGTNNFVYESRTFWIIPSGYPAMAQGHFFKNIVLPETFNPIDNWVFYDRNFSVTHVGQVTVGTNTFPDCIRVDIDDTANSSTNFAGTGYFILARDVGIVKIVFQRTEDSSVVSYEYVEHQQFTSNTISGTVSVGGEYAVGKMVQLHNASWGIRSIVDASGVFSLQAYGPVLTLRIGNDINLDGNFDTDVPGWPKEYVVTNITGNTSVDIAF